MTNGAIVFMVFSMTVLWGGLGCFLGIATKNRRNNQA